VFTRCWLQVDEFYSKLEELGVRSYVDKAELVYVNIEGLPYYTALLLECQYEVPTRTWVCLPSLLITWRTVVRIVTDLYVLRLVHLLTRGISWYGGREEVTYPPEKTDLIPYKHKKFTSVPAA
jgi:hypothetical protein